MNIWDDVYRRELYNLACFVVQTCDEVFGLNPEPVGGLTLTAAGPTHQKIASVLNAAANIAKLLTAQGRDQRAAYKTNARLYKIHTDRVANLRTLLGGAMPVELMNKAVRNSIEHFDERLDAMNEQIERGTIKNVTYNVSLSKKQAMPIDYVLRMYVSSEKAYYNCGQRIDLGKVREECTAICACLAATRPNFVDDVTGAAVYGNAMMTVR